ncbi:MAG: RNA pseudouridine synthase [Myxococcales bacterium]|nr:RNA pseudouridine synthase [Myxococcales bacterium]
MTEEPRPRNTPTSLRILFEDRDLVVIDKPAGLPSTGRTLDDPHSAQAVLTAQLGRFVWAVHQIDAGTTGLLLFVRKKSAVDVFTDKLKKGEKRYLAVAAGRVAKATQELTGAIGWDDARKRWAVLADDAAGAKTARTSVEALSTSDRASLVSARIFTGRTHQVRVHLTHAGHPLLGDSRYAPPEVAALFERPALHAWSMTLSNVAPLVCPIPIDLQGLLAREGLALPD